VLRKPEVLTFIGVFAFSALCFGDQITLKNGDRLTGTVVKSDGKTLVLHTDAAGDITIQYSSIQEIKTEEELHVTLKGGKTAVGPVSTTDGKIEVATKTSGTVEAPAGDVTLIRNDAEQDAYEKSLHPGLLHGWTGGANVGFSVARGNSETENLALAFNAVHTSISNKLTLYATSIDTSNNLASPSTVANLDTGGIRFDHNVSSRTFVFAAADYMANALQFLDLRSIYSGGFGVHAIANDRTTLDFLGGLAYTHETYSNGPVVPGISPPVFVSYGVTNRFLALTFGDNLATQLGKTTSLTQTFEILPDLQQTGQYQFTFNVGTVTKLSKWFGWQNQFGDIYVSNPPIGTKSNDVLFTTGLNVSFTR
jgi:putative salt-induced outer membrane protein YdiY